MTRFVALLACTVVVGAPAGRAAAAGTEPIISHGLRVRIEPATHRLTVHDRLVIPAALATRPLEFILNDALTVKSATPGLAVQRTRANTAAAEAGMDRAAHGDDPSVRVNVYRVTGAVPGRAFTLELDYAGLINHPVVDSAAQYARGFSESPGLIEARGVYLAGATHWVPEIGTARIRYRLETDLPAGWTTVSQGVREDTAQPAGQAPRSHAVWRVDTPTEQVHLIAARFTEYARDAGTVKAYAFLRTPDPALAARYLEATGRYLAMYQAALGPYPYGKFALVENFWETGYGMPSFTLLGEQIIRFPFILTSSYPHELLHNWWGNGVFVDFGGGNWCEGLTAYLADHLLAEQQGQGEAHRRDILERVTDYVTDRNDVPLRRFLGRHDAPSEALGYGKAAMMWNMLRARVGDAQFLASLRRFYRDQLFRSARFDDIRLAFERTTGQDLGAFFAQWVDGTGVPQLALTSATRSGNRLTMTIAQTQAVPLDLDVPVAVQTARGAELHSVALSRDSGAVTASFDLDAPATRVDIDPQFQVYRRLSPLETPPSLSKAFGAARVLIVVPAGGRDAVYAGLFKAWARDGVQVADDSELASLPTDRPVWVVGQSNRFLPQVAAALRQPGVVLDREALRVGDTSYPSQGKSIVAVARNAANPATVLVYLSAPSAAAADGLARKLPHYGKYSWLVFGGSAPDNEAKGEWTTGESPLTHVFEPGTASPRLPVRKPLAERPALFDATRLRAEVDWLAAPQREGRGIGTQGLDAAARHIADAFRAAGLEPPDGRSYFEDFMLPGPDGSTAAARNVIGVLRGTNPILAGQSLVISAHYDHLGFGWPDVHAGDAGRLHPGADDNASGVAVLLELARVLADAHPDRSILFAAFSGEEEGLVGSRAFVRAAAESRAPYPLAGIMADLNLDTVGRLGIGKLSVLGADSAREWPFIFSGVTATIGVPVTVVTRAVDASDHAAFVEAGVPAVQFFASSAEDYHRPGDTADKIDVAGLASVGTVLKEVAEYLAARPDPLHFTGTAKQADPAPARAAGSGASAERRASTGLVPDMGAEGTGVRAASIVPGSGAEAAGLQAGDRILSLAGVPTPDLKALAEALKTVHPGDIVEVEFARDAQRAKVKLTLGAR